MSIARFESEASHFKIAGTISPFDARFYLGKRVKALVALYRRRLGKDADLDAVDLAARLQALADDARIRARRGDPSISSDDVARLQASADRLIRRLDRGEP